MNRTFRSSEIPSSLAVTHAIYLFHIPTFSNMSPFQPGEISHLASLSGPPSSRSLFQRDDDDGPDLGARMQIQGSTLSIGALFGGTFLITFHSNPL